MPYASNISALQGTDKRVYVYLNPKIAKHFYKSVSAGKDEFEGEGFAIYGILEDVRDSGIFFNRIFTEGHYEAFSRDLQMVEDGEKHRDSLYEDHLESMFIPWSSIVAIV
jgi:hypothetical protein